MIAFLIGFLVSLFTGFVGIPLCIRLVNRLHYGQYIRQDGPQSHQIKRGTPTMGGVVIVAATVAGWTASALYRNIALGIRPSNTAMLVLFAMISMGSLGFIDDFAKVAKKQNEGLSIHMKFIGQFAFATIFALLTLMFDNSADSDSARSGITFIEKTVISFDALGKIVSTILFILWINLLMAAWTNAFNLTDGLDGLCAGNSIFAFFAYVVIGLWQSNHIVGITESGFGYNVPASADLAIIAACAAAACFAFLWYNTNPALIFMGDTGSLSLGGLFAALSVATHTEILAVLIGGLFVIETLSDVIQISCFKMTRKRVFKMAPIHHHFELMGWPENKVVVRFWMIEALFSVIGMIVFYTNWVAESGIA